jgi:hypothetical protein
MTEVIDTVGLLWTAMILAYGVIAVALVIGRWALNRIMTTSRRAARLRRWTLVLRANKVVE